MENLSDDEKRLINETALAEQRQAVIDAAKVEIARTVDAGGKIIPIAIPVNPDDPMTSYVRMRQSMLAYRSEGWEPTGPPMVHMHYTPDPIYAGAEASYAEAHNNFTGKTGAIEPKESSFTGLRRPPYMPFTVLYREFVQSEGK